jgi:hypothetical protein
MNLPMSCLAATLAAMRFAYDKSDSNFNNVGVRSFILYGAPNFSVSANLAKFHTGL